MATVKIAPLTRIEGHLDIEAELAPLGGMHKVVRARCSGTMFRGFEIILGGRDPRDAVHYTQRICGVCPISHGMAASKTLEAACRVEPTDNGRIMRNLVLGSNFLQSHILHFYHLALPDYVNTQGLLDIAPWTPRWTSSDMLTGSLARRLVDHYVQALHMRRKAHQMGAIFGGRLPCAATFVPGGCSDSVTSTKINQFRALLTDLSWFCRVIYLEDVELLGAQFPDYWRIGRGCGNLLAYGAFDLDAAGQRMLFQRGAYTAGRLRSVDPERIIEYVRYSQYSPASGPLPPSQGNTVPQPGKSGAYSWLKAPRYLYQAHEVGPLARMWINGDYRRGISVMDRLMARALEAVKLAGAMAGWLEELRPSTANQRSFSVPAAATGMGLTEAPRGALGHWLVVQDRVINRYQVVTPTAWNVSPQDDFGQAGPVEQALAETPVADPQQPIELMRVVHSFDPCMACSVHVLRRQ